MNKILQRSVASIALLTSPVMAADMAVKAPPPPAAPVYNWTGWYVGGNIGASFGHVKTDYSIAPVTLLGLIGTTSIPLSPPIPGSAGSHEITNPSGFIGGAQIGYNWQLSPIWVVGLEADFQGADEKDSNGFTNSASLLGGDLVGTAVTTYQTKIDWFGTVRGRIGYLWGDGAVLTYLTGGLAYGRVGISGTTTESGFLVVPTNSFSISHTLGHSQINTGWVVGYGIEGKLLIPGWTYRIESLYMDLGTLDDTDAAAQVTGATGGQIFTHTHFTDGILRAGLNYQFH